jgi:HEAT repeat protein
VVVAAGVVWHQNREPKYRGKTLSEWVRLNGRSNLGFNTEENPQEALRHFGTNALPYLVRAIQYQRPAWKAKFWALLRRIPMPKAQRRKLSIAAIGDMMRANDAQTAFQALGPIAAPAVPQLYRIMFASSNEQVSATAMHCLAAIGPAGLPVLRQALTNFAATATFRENAVQAVSEMDTNALPLVPTLLAWLHQTNHEIAYVAIMVLGELQLRPELVVPALTNKLGETTLRRDAMEALGSFEKEADSAIPHLLQLLNDPEAETAAGAASALADIGERADIVVPALVRLMIENRAEEVRGAAAMAIAQFGEKARLALPALEAALHHQDGSVREAARTALQMIAPETIETNSAAAAPRE